jgi:hypothetical protein
MAWIDDILVGTDRESGTEFLRKSGRTTSVETTKNPAKQTAATLKAWKALVFAITNDVNDFNNHPTRAKLGAVRVHDKLLSRTHFQCEIYLPGMRSKMLVLALENDNDVKVSIHPEFPKQRFDIRLESDKESDCHFLVLGDTPDKTTELSVEQLSEYLLKPVLSLAESSKATK